MSENPGRMIWAIVKRNWWIPVIAAVVAGAVVGFGAWSAPVVYSSTIGLNASTVTLGGNPYLPSPDGMLAVVRGGDFAEKVKTAMDDENADFTLAASVAGNPSNRLNITATASDPAVAEAAVRAASDMTMKTVADLSVVEVAQYQERIERADSALKELDSVSSTADPNVIYYEYNIQANRANDVRQMAYVQGVFGQDPNVVSSATSPKAEAVKRGGAAGLLGLVLGLVVVAIREGLARRRAAAQ